MGNKLFAEFANPKSHYETKIEILFTSQKADRRTVTKELPYLVAYYSMIINIYNLNHILFIIGR